jgi:hypothetical protein
MSNAITTRSPSDDELFGTFAHGGQVSVPSGINWTYVIIGGVVIVGVVGTFAYLSYQSQRRQEEMLASASSSGESNISALKAFAATHSASQDKLHTKLDRIEQGIEKATTLIQNIEPQGKVLAQDISPIIQAVVDITHQSKSNSTNQ